MFFGSNISALSTKPPVLTKDYTSITKTNSSTNPDITTHHQVLTNNSD